MSPLLRLCGCFYSAITNSDEKSLYAKSFCVCFDNDSVRWIPKCELIGIERVLFSFFEINVSVLHSNFAAYILYQTGMFSIWINSVSMECICVSFP